MRRLIAFAVVAILFFVAAPLLLAQTPLIGTWKLNLAKSKSSSGSLPKSLTRTVEAQGDKVKYSFEGTAADGNAIAWSFTVAYDGKDYPITGYGASGGADSIAIKQLSPTSFTATMKKAGDLILLTRVTVSKDGKTTTLVQTNAPRKPPVHHISVYDKQ